MTKSELLSRPRFLYQVADFLCVDRRTLSAILRNKGMEFASRRLLMPAEINEILQKLGL